MAKATKKTSKKTVQKTAAADGLDSSREWSLDEVEAHLPKVSAGDVDALREALLEAQTEEQLATLGSGYRTEDILAAAPTFTVGGLYAMGKLGGPPPGLAPGYFPLLLRETRELDRLNTQYEQQARDVTATISGRRALLKSANSAALDARRNVAQTLLRTVVPVRSKHRAELEKAAAGADSYAGTVASVRSVARIVTALREDPKLAKVLDQLGYTAAYVDELRGLADEVERLTKQGAGLTPPQKTDQSVLDAQDGLVLIIMRAIWAPLRDAKSRGRRVRLPRVGGLARFFSSASGDTGDEEPAPIEGAPPTEA